MGWPVRRWEQSQEGFGRGGYWACGKSHGQGVAARRWRWEAPEGAFPSKRLVACLSVAPHPVPFTQQMLEQAGVWVRALRANGGSGMVAPMLATVQQGSDIVVMLLTDGQMGSEDEVLCEVCAARSSTRVYSFGIGTNVSDMLLRDLPRHTSWAGKFIYPGERLDEKVVTQFARTVAPRSSVVVNW